MYNDYSQLLIDVQKKSNITVTSLRDVKFLKEEIDTNIDNSIGFNTLRRLFGFLDKTLDGKHRPGHFNGVAQVVKRLFEIVTPDKAFFGEKDYQQVMIIKALVKQMGSSIEIVSCPILREADGLAMSSRNTLLTSEGREIASLIPKLMWEAKKIVKEKSISAAKLFIEEETKKVSLMKLDYFEICDAETLEGLSEINSQKKAIALIAIFVGKIRLIDNLQIS